MDGGDLAFEDVVVDTQRSDYEHSDFSLASQSMASDSFDSSQSQRVRGIVAGARARC